VQIRRAAEDQYGSVAKYAEIFGLGYDRLTKILRGVEIMRLEDIARAQRHLDVESPWAKATPRVGPVETA
jgi:hypothetical protein